MNEPEPKQERGKIAPAPNPNHSRDRWRVYQATERANRAYHNSDITRSRRRLLGMAHDSRNFGPGRAAIAGPQPF